MAIIDPGHAAKQLIYERIFRSATLIAAVLVLLILGGVAVSLLRGAWPALSGRSSTNSTKRSSQVCCRSYAI